MSDRRPLVDLPLRWRLIVVVVAVSLIALASTSLATTSLLREYLIKRTDADLVQTSESLRLTQYASLLNQSEADRNRFVAPNTYRVEFIPVLPTGELLTGGAIFVPATRDASAPSLPALPPEHELVRSGEPFTVPSIDGSQQWRVRAGMTEYGDMVWLMATPLDPVDKTVTQVTSTGALVGVIALLGCLAVAWLLITEAFRPLRQMESTAAAIAAGDLTRRIPQRRAHDEVTSLADSLNVMLGRIEESFATREASEQRMRQFVADASHELRTPLAVVRGYAELYRQGGLREEEHVAAAMSRIEHEAQRLGHLVEELLTLTRATNAEKAQVEELDLLVVASEAVSDVRVLDPDRHVRLVGLDGELSPVEIRGHEAGLRQVLGNLLANAVRHTPAGSDVEVALGRRGSTARVEVRDHGVGIPADLRTKVFERFYRTDPSRNRAQGGGSGLGLAIVAAIVAGHQGTIHVEETPGGGATFVLQLPVDGPTTGSAAQEGTIAAERSAVRTGTTGPIRTSKWVTPRSSQEKP